MNKHILKSELDAALKKFEAEFESLQSRGFEEETQCAINELGNITFKALKSFEKSIIDNMD